MRRNKPIFQTVVDLGLRDVGVSGEPRRFVAHMGKWTAAFAVVMFFVLLLACAYLRGTALLVFGPAFLIGTISFAWFVTMRSPRVVVKVQPGRTNQAAWFPIAFFVLSLPMAALAQDALSAVVVVATGVMALVVWRARHRVPALLEATRAGLAAGEVVLGDGTGIVNTTSRDGFRLVVCTDRRVLVASLRAPLLDLPYAEITGYGAEWKVGGRVGTLELHAGAETHVVAAINPLNLLSIMRALESHGVAPDDPTALPGAERAWQEAQRPREPLLDRDALRTPAFSRGLWLLLGASLPLLYVVKGGSGPLMLGVFALVCVASGYVSGTRHSLLYVVPLCVLLLPMFVYLETPELILLMLMVSAIAGACLLAGSALRRASSAPAGTAARGSLNEAVSGSGLVRLSGLIMTATLVLLMAGSLAGFDLTTVRLALAETSAEKLPADGRSNLTGGAASLTYTPGRGLRELIKDEHYDAGPNDGARWELRTPFTKGDNVVSLSHYVFDAPRLDNPASVAKFVAGKDAEHVALAGTRVGHSERVVDGRKGYVWTHGDARGYWYQVAWFPHPVHTIRVECIAREQKERFRRLCAEATASLKFR